MSLCVVCVFFPVIFKINLITLNFICVLMTEKEDVECQAPKRALVRFVQLASSANSGSRQCLIPSPGRAILDEIRRGGASLLGAIRWEKQKWIKGRLRCQDTVEIMLKWKEKMLVLKQRQGAKYAM